MTIGNNTFWIIVIDNQAITPKDDKRYALKFESSESANAYAEAHHYQDYAIVCVPG